MSERMENIIGAVCFIGLVLSIIMLVGIAGAVDTDLLGVGDAARRGIVWLIIFLASACGIIYLERDEDEYGEL